MIVKLTKHDAQMLERFLLDVLRFFQVPESFRKPLVRVIQDAKSAQIESSRFTHVYPILSNAHGVYVTRVSRMGQYREIARWKRILVLPAVWEYFRKVRPLQKFRTKQVREVGELCAFIKGRIAGGAQ